MLWGTIKIDDAYLGGDHSGGKTGQEWENNNPTVAAVSLNEAGHPIHTKITQVCGFSSEAILAWARENFAPVSAVLFDGLACFRSGTTTGCSHEAIVTGSTHPNDLPQFCWISIVFGNLKISLSGTLYAFQYDKHLRRYLDGYCFRFNRQCSLAAMIERMANVVCCCMPCTETGS